MAGRFPGRYSGGVEESFLYTEDDNDPLLAELVPRFSGTVIDDEEEGSNTIYVGGVDPEMIEDEVLLEGIIDMFSECGDIISYSFPNGMPMKHGMTYFFITYRDPISVLRAIKKWNSKPFRVNVANRELPLRKTVTLEPNVGRPFQTTFPQRVAHTPPQRISQSPSIRITADREGRRVSVRSLQDRLAQNHTVIQEPSEGGRRSNTWECPVCYVEGWNVKCPHCIQGYCSKQCLASDVNHKSVCRGANNGTSPVGRQNMSIVSPRNISEGPNRSGRNDNSGSSSVENNSGRKFRSGQQDDLDDDNNPRAAVKQRGHENRDSDQNSSTPGRQSFNKRNDYERQDRFDDKRDQGNRMPRQSRDGTNDQKGNYGRSEDKEHKYRENDQGEDSRRNFGGGNDGYQRQNRNRYNDENKEGNQGQYRQRQNNDVDGERKSFRNDGDSKQNRGRQEDDSEGRQQRNLSDNGDGPQRRNFRNDGNEGGQRRNFRNNDNEGGQRRNFRNDDNEGGQRRNFRNDGDTRQNRGQRNDMSDGGQRRNYNNDGGEGRPRRNYNNDGDRQNRGRDDANGDKDGERAPRRNFRDNNDNRGRQDNEGDRRQNRNYNDKDGQQRQRRYNNREDGPRGRNSEGQREGQNRSQSTTADDNGWDQPSTSSTVNDRLDSIRSAPTSSVACPTSTVELPEGAYSEVLVISVQGDVCFVQRILDATIIIDLTNSLQIAAQSSKPVEPSLGLFCLAKFMGNWYRAVVDSISPQVIVTFIDYGNQDQCSNTDLLEIPSSLSTTPRLALKLKLPERLPEKYKTLNENDQIFVMPLEKLSDGTVKVQVQDPDSVSTPTVQQPAVAVPADQPIQQAAVAVPADQPIPADTFGKVLVVYKVPERANEWWVQSEPDVERSNRVLQEIHSRNVGDTAACIPEIGQLCCATYENVWCRARVINVEPEIQVFFIDYGNVATVTPEMIRSLPEDLAAVPALAFHVFIPEGTPQEKYVNVAEMTEVKIKLLQQIPSGAWVVLIEGCDESSITLPQGAHPVVQPSAAVVGSAVNTVPANVTEFIVTHKYPHNNKEYYVHSLDENSSAVDMNVRLLELCPEQPPCTPVIGGLCCVCYRSLWYRARVMLLEPKIQVLLIDYGNTEDLDADAQLLTVPEEYRDVPKFGKLICFEDGTPEEFLNNISEFDSVIRVSVLRKVRDKTIVSALSAASSTSEPTAASSASEPTAVSSTSEPTAASSASEPTAASSASELTAASNVSSSIDFIKTFEVDSDAVVEILGVYKDFFTSIILAPEHGNYLALVQQLEKAGDTIPENHVPSSGELALLYSDSKKRWCRGYVLYKKQNKYLAYLCDDGLIEFVSAVKRLPADYVNMPKLAMKCEVLSSAVDDNVLRTQYIKGRQRFILNVNRVEEESLIGHLMNIEPSLEVCKLKVVPWEPTDVEFGPYRYVEFSEVLLTGISENTVHLRSVSAADMMLHQELQQNLNAYCGKAQPLQQLPAKRDLVGCFSSRDNTYYRGLVNSVDETSTDVHVSFVDLGDFEIVKLVNVRALPLELKSYPFQATRRILKDVPIMDFTVEVRNYLTSIINNKEILKYESLLSRKDDLVLKRPNGEIINEKVKNLMESIETQQNIQPPVPVNDLPTSPQQRSEAGQLMMETSLGFQEFAVGADTCFYLWHVLDDLGLMCSSFDKDFVTAITHTMTAQLNEYCTRVTESYTPNKHELCLAKFPEDGAWYRAVCEKKVIVKNSCVVTYIDYGNSSVVPIADIRKMTPEFMRLPRLTVKCVIEELEAVPEERREQVKKAIPSLKVYNGRVECKIDEGEYLVSIPELIATLKSLL